MDTLFDNNKNLYKPLAARMQPRNLDEYIGHDDVIGKNTLLRKLIDNNELISCIFWAPPGSGKTSLAQVIAGCTQSVFIDYSAVSGSVRELREIIKGAEERLLLHGQKTLLFIDEIHRFNKAQQDIFLPYVEKGIIILIGATTENPSFEVNSALLSRCKVFKLEALSHEYIIKIIKNALSDSQRGLGMYTITYDEACLDFIATHSGGDARFALNTLEFIVKAQKGNSQIHIRIEDVQKALAHSYVSFDKAGEEFYNTISALHKSMRGSDVDGALYWLGRMLEGGADPLYITRRLIRFASEDIGISDLHALPLAVSTYNAVHYIGMPECEVNIAHCVVYLAQAVKDNRVYTSYKKVKKVVHETKNAQVPLHLRNAPTKLMKDFHYGKGYKYNHDYEGDIDQVYMPPELVDIIFFPKE
jgi:putative ATPase